MFALEVEYLTDRAIASKFEDHEKAEWPPHPGRLFMALVAAHAERDLNDSAERAALQWLEGLKPPEIHASGASERDVVEVFVPVNDNLGPDKVPKGGFSASIIRDKIRVLPDRRSKQARTFPSVTPQSARVFFIWSEVDPDQLMAHRTALERLAANVSYLGHSSSLVRVAFADNPPPATLLPSDEGTLVLRVPTPGRLNDLMAAFQRQHRPSMGFFCSYARATHSATLPESMFSSLIAFRLIGPNLPLTAAARLTAGVREAVMNHSEIQPAPEILSGHSPDNGPSQRDHLAYLPLPFVEHRFADGIIRGFAAAIPRDIKGDERTLVLRALGRLDARKKSIWLGSLGDWSVERITDERVNIQSLQPDRYIGPSRSWATVTPMIFDQFPKDRAGRDATAVIARACQRIGLPVPVSVDISHVSRLRGAPTSAEFKIRPKLGLPARPYAHVSLRFDQPVRGLIVLGAGRYQGLGLFRAIDS
jgi:CRISPR-associated protein Csb2